MADDLPPLLGPFPIDDATLALVESALDTTVDFTDEGQRRLVGGPFTLAGLLDHLSGYDHDPDSALLVGEIDGIPVYESAIPRYHHTDVIRALVAEVHRLRAAAPSEEGDR